jgi:hypothetical protein
MVKVKVFNDGDEVYTGPLDKWLEHNDNNEEITEMCNPLITGETDEVSFAYFSGEWIVRRND